MSGQGAWNRPHERAPQGIASHTGLHSPREGFLDFILNAKGGRPLEGLEKRTDAVRFKDDLILG